MSVGTEGSGPNPRTYSRAEYAALEAENARLNDLISAARRVTGAVIEERDALRAELAGVKQASLELAGSIGRRHDVVTQLRAELAELQERASEEWQAVKHDLDVARAELAEVKGREAACFVVGKLEKTAVVDSPLPVGTKLYALPPASPDVEGLVNELQRIAEKCSDPDTTDALDTALSTWRQSHP